MKPSLQQKLYKRFPFLRGKRRKGGPKYPIDYGLAVGDGWHDLLYEACLKIEAELKKHSELKDKFEMVQVKEKFGRIRIYANGMSDVMVDAVAEAEGKSGNICEFCGKEGQEKNVGGWLKTMCDKCFDKEMERRRKMRALNIAQSMGAVGEDAQKLSKEMLKELRK